MIKLEHVSKYYDDSSQPVVNDLSFEIETGELLVILGSSGCGKTTTLKMINRLIEPTSGNIYIDARPIKSFDIIELRRSIGYVFQKIGLFPHLTVSENISVVLRLLKHSKKQCYLRACELLDFVNLDPNEYAARLPQELSGGQQQRVGVARALANNPDYLLMDEPFGAVDSINREQLQKELLALQRQLKKTIIFVTHDIFEAVRLADRIAIMDKGRLQQIGDPQTLINKPENAFVNNLFSTIKEQIQHYSGYVEN